MTFVIDTATADQIREHLASCDLMFEPPLRSYVEIPAYSRKVAEHAVTFEAWVGGVLVGLVAAYYNDRTSGRGFITSVSVLRDFLRSGIANQLVRNAIEHGAVEGFKTLALEVNATNSAAIGLYEKHGFTVAKTAGNKLTLECRLVSADRSV